VLWWALQRLWPGLRRKQRTFKKYLSHDVDRPFCTKSLPRVLKNAVEDIVERRTLPLAKRRVRSFAQVKRGYLDHDICNTFDFIMDLSEKHGLRSSFYFMTERTAGRIDGNYSMADPWIKALLRRIHERGHEIGLHPSYNTFRDPEQVRREFHILLKAAETENIAQRGWGGRQHYLRWEAPTTWQAWENANLDYDATLGFADRIGFRGGVCYEYRVFNLRTRAVLKLRERPLVVMEDSALGGRYMGLTFEQARREIDRLKDRCKLFDGDFTLLWHNSRLVDERERELYRDVVAS
jgi:peptidoglycan/xylan/chitin deacetylase (PgdA/CDA1 family)